MLSFPSSRRVFAWSGVTDMRRAMDGLAALVDAELGRDALSGDLFLFANRRRDRLKILVWDQSGYWVLYKRLERGTFHWPTGTDVAELDGAELALLLGGLDLTQTKRRRWYRRDARKKDVVER